ncbi:MAG: HNH endonuclease [bacterium]
MERIVQEYKLKKIDRTTAIEKVEKNAFNDVIPRFHVVNKDDIPIKFYEFNENKLILTDNTFKMLFENEDIKLQDEVTSRWDLLEAAFAMKRKNNNLINDIRKFYLKNGYDRQDITHTVPVLNGYQNDICFYCGEKMTGQVHVDHVIPRQLIRHDEIWNLVLAHGFCNEQKSDALPPEEYIRKMIERNEHFIQSNHPIKNKLKEQLGNTAKQRAKHIYKVYDDAKFVIGYTWEGIRGYNPMTDDFYKTFIRGYINN